MLIDKLTKIKIWLLHFISDIFIIASDAPSDKSTRVFRLPSKSPLKSNAQETGAMLFSPIILLVTFFLTPDSTRQTSPGNLYKGYSGYRAFKNSTRMVVYHDQTVAILEIGSDKTLLNCELVEVYEPEEVEDTMASVSKFCQPQRIHLDLMMDWMGRCHRLKTPDTLGRAAMSTDYRKEAAGKSSLLSGVLPGTFWCGSGDIADTYFDLGEEEGIDRCCRSHDLCPSKIRGHTARYNMTNDNLYTMSHCKCDGQFNKCLKKVDTPTADMMGHFYFDLLRVPCLADRAGRKVIQNSENYS